MLDDGGLAHAAEERAGPDGLALAQGRLELPFPLGVEALAGLEFPIHDGVFQRIADVLNGRFSRVAHAVGPWSRLAAVFYTQRRYVHSLF